MKTYKVEFLKDAKGHDENSDGSVKDLSEYKKGEVAVICESLYKHFKAEKSVKDHKGKVEAKEADGPPENKSKGFFGR